MLAEFVFGTIEVDDIEDEELSPEDACINCGEETITPDDRTGLIHAHGMYSCFVDVNGKMRWTGTVAE